MSKEYEFPLQRLHTGDKPVAGDYILAAIAERLERLVEVVEALPQQLREYAGKTGR